MRKRITFIFIAALALLAARPAGAEDVYRRLPLSELKLKEGVLPAIDNPMQSLPDWHARQGVQPSVALAGPGEIYLEFTAQSSDRFMKVYAPESYMVDLRTPQVGPLSGRICWPDPQTKQAKSYEFTLPAIADGSGINARKSFWSAKANYYADQARRGTAGAAWFRHQEAAARAEAGQTSAAQALDTGVPMAFRTARAQSGMDETYDLFSGGRAISENLQLDRNLNVGGGGTETVELKTIAGISTREMDWSKLTAGMKPQTDPLARLVPADQHAIFFPSFQAMIDVMDEARREGTPLLHLAESRSEDARTRERYEKQLCLAADALGRLIGPKVVASVAFTGSDPYLRSGSDVAVIFEAVDPKVLGPLIAARQGLALQAEPAAKAVSGETGGVPWKGVRSPDRAVCSYMAVIKNAVVVTNSLYQLGRIVETSQGKTPSLDKLGEYTFFRDRYKRGEAGETALVILSDPAIRRWCDARWRIGASRRVRAAAALSELQARNLEALAHGETPERTAIPGAGEITWSKTGPASSIYGDLAFMTPIGELEMAKVSADEAAAYNRFRDRYQQNWRNYFDPIAVRLTVQAGRLATDLTVMPLILGSDFRRFTEFTQNAALKAGAGDPHPEAWMHVALAIDKDAEMFKQVGQTMSMMRGSAGQGVAAPNPLGWLGGAVAVYADSDPFWKELLEAPKREEFGERNFPRLPVGVCIEVSDGLKLALFLTTLRGLVEQTAPGMTRWSNETYKDKPYVKIGVNTGGRQSEAETSGSLPLAIYYASTPRALVISPNKALVERALDRLTTSSASAGAGAGAGWLGKQLGVKVGRAGLELFQALVGESYQHEMQDRAWSNLPILNEWRRLYPKEPPVAFHERFWKTRLTSPGGGEYVWNEGLQTMESTVYGCPAAPKTGPKLPEALSQVTAIAMGLTFENDGLRGQASIERESARK